MADYPTVPASPSTPDPAPDPAEAADTRALLASLAAIPREELPDGDDRDALAWLISHGFVDNLYTPFGCPTHTIAWSHRPAWRDPRETVADWLAARRVWAQRGELIGQRAELARKERGDDGE